MYVALALLGDGTQPARLAVERISSDSWALIEAFNSGSHAAPPTVDGRKALVNRTSVLATAIRRSATTGGGGAR